MILTLIDGIAHIRGEESRRKFATFDPTRGTHGTLQIRHNGEECEIDVAALLALVPTDGKLVSFMDR
jgi:hypothetical protein